MISIITQLRNETIQINADNVVHITCYNCQPRNKELYLSFCGEWKPLIGLYKEDKTYCPMCEYVYPSYQHKPYCK